MQKEPLNQQELFQRLSVLYENRMRFVGFSGGLNGLNRDHRYNIILCLALNPDWSFTSGELAGHMPFTTSPNIVWSQCATLCQPEDPLHAMFVLEKDPTSQTGTSIGLAHSEDAFSFLHRHLSKLEEVPTNAFTATFSTKLRFRTKFYDIHRDRNSIFLLVKTLLLQALLRKRDSEARFFPHQ